VGCQVAVLRQSKARFCRSIFELANVTGDKVMQINDRWIDGAVTEQADSKNGPVDLKDHSLAS